LFVQIWNEHRVVVKTSSIAATFLLVLFSATAQTLPGTVLWSTNLGDFIIGSPALALDNSLRVRTLSGLFSLERQGAGIATKWFFPASVRFYGTTVNLTPTVAPDGTVYFGGDGSNGPVFHAVNPDGSEKWSYAVQPDLQYAAYYVYSAGIMSDDTICFAAGGCLFAFSPSGAKKWQSDSFFEDNRQSIAPIFGPDGTIYLGSLSAFDAAGTRKWWYPLDGGGDSAIGPDGTIYSIGTTLFALRPNGTTVWPSSVGFDFDQSSPAVGPDGTIYVGQYINKLLWSFKPSGETNWVSAFNEGCWHNCVPTATPAIDSSGTIYYCNTNSVLSLNPQGGTNWFFRVPNYPYGCQSPVIGYDGTLYVASDGSLYAFYGTNGPAAMGWPMYRQNARHTGKAEKPSISNPNKRSDGAFEFQLYAQVGQSFAVQASTNLQDWSGVTNFVCDSLPMTLADPEATNFVSRFYRVVSP
jgi:hypothetical protein